MTTENIKDFAAEQARRALANARGPNIKLVPFHEIKLGPESRYRVKGLIPYTGLVVVWGPPKCFKSFWVFDLVMHVALGWEYRGRRVQQGHAVYCAFEGQKGFEARAEAFRQQHNIVPEDLVPFHLEPVRIDLVRDHAALVAVIRDSLGEQHPAVVILDTLNRSLHGSESSDEDMGAYIKAADAIREAFDCVVIIVHHCGIDGTRPRGHTSLGGAVETQLAVERKDDKALVTVEWMKDGPEGDLIASKLEVVTVGTDQDGDDITSLVVVPADVPEATRGDTRLKGNQQSMFSILFEAGQRGLSLEEWNEKARAIGIGRGRPATLYDIRTKLKRKGLIIETANGWAIKHPLNGA